MTVSVPLVWAIGDQVVELEPSTKNMARYQHLHDRLNDLSEVGAAMTQLADEEDLALEASAEFVWIAKDIRNDLLCLMDAEATEGDDPKVMPKLQSAFDMFNGYVRDNMAQLKADDAEYAMACGNYDDEMAANDSSSGMSGMGEADLAEAVLKAKGRQKSATIVRTKPDGTKEYKFPIPDKAHAKAALAYINRSDLTPTEKAKVRKKAHAMLGMSASQTTKESSADMIDHMEAESQLLDISEATVDLAKGELEVTFLKPGFNKSGYRYYTSEAIREAVDNGMFNNLKMFMNHQTPQEMNQRPERDLKDWVSTMKETWVDSNGAAKGKVKVVQGWFQSFLKDLQESGAIGEIGLSIFAQGKVKPTRIDNRQTNVVERFQKAMSVDWVTEPGAGGRVDQMWESYQPVMHKEQELNVLQSMSADEAIRTLKESRPEVIEAIANEIKNGLKSEERLTEAAGEIQSLIEKVKELENDKAAAIDLVAKTLDMQVEDKQKAYVVESLSKTELPQVGKDRLRDHLMVKIHRSDDGKFDETAAAAALKESVDAELAYVNSLVKETGGKGIKGLGSTTSAETVAESDSSALYKRIGDNLAKGMMIEPDAS